MTLNALGKVEIGTHSLNGTTEKKVLGGRFAVGWVGAQAYETTNGGQSWWPITFPAASATSSESAAAAPVPEAPPAEQPFAKSILGTWDNNGAKLTFNSKGRMKMHWGDPPCFGTYAIEGNRLGVTYDAGTKGCTWGSPERIRVNEPSLDIGPVTYKRVDNKDDTSF